MSAPRPRLSVIVPVFNEETLIGPAIESLLGSLVEIEPQFELILSENGSTDRTPELAEQLRARNPAVRVIRHPQPDYGRALQNGFLASRGSELAHFSVDFIDLDFLRAALPMLESYDIVLGSEHIAPGTDRRPLLRRYGGQVFHWLVRHLFGLPIRDTHGIKALRRDRVLGLIGHCQQGGALFDDELILRAHQAGLRMKELPVQVAETRPSRRGVASQALGALIGLARLRLALWRDGREPTA